VGAPRTMKPVTPLWRTFSRDIRYVTAEANTGIVRTSGWEFEPAMTVAGPIAEFVYTARTLRICSV
jgi:hypothetical protein